MLSGAGGALARRRPEISWFSLRLGPLVFGFILLFFFSVNLPKNPNLSSFVFFSPDRHLWNGEREQCFIISLNQTSSINLSLNRAKEFLHQSNEDAAGQIWGLYRSGKQTKPDPASPDDAVAQIWRLYRSGKQIKSDPALRPSSSYKSTKNLSKQCDRPLPPLCDSSPIIIRNLQNGGVDNSNFFSSNNDITRVWLDEPHLFWWPNTPTRPMTENCKEAQLIHIQALCLLTDPSPSLSKSRYTLSNVLSRSLLKIWCSIKNGRRRHSILVTTSSVETCIHQCQNLINRVDGLSPNATLSVASSMEQIIKSSYASFARATYDHKLIRNFKLEFLKVSKDFPTFANSLKMCILDYSLSLYLFLSCIGLLSACMNFPLLRF